LEHSQELGQPPQEQQHLVLWLLAGLLHLRMAPINKAGLPKSLAKSQQLVALPNKLP
jgi:hypothetical protein